MSDDTVVEMLVCLVLSESSKQYAAHSDPGVTRRAWDVEKRRRTAQTRLMGLVRRLDASILAGPWVICDFLARREQEQKDGGIGGEGDSGETHSNKQIQAREYHGRHQFMPRKKQSNAERDEKQERHSRKTESKKQSRRGAGEEAPGEAAEERDICALLFGTVSQPRVSTFPSAACSRRNEYQAVVCMCISRQAHPSTARGPSQSNLAAMGWVASHLATREGRTCARRRTRFRDGWQRACWSSKRPLDYWRVCHPTESED